MAHKMFVFVLDDGWNEMATLFLIWFACICFGHFCLCNPSISTNQEYSGFAPEAQRLPSFFEQYFLTHDRRKRTVGNQACCFEGLNVPLFEQKRPLNHDFSLSYGITSRNPLPIGQLQLTIWPDPFLIWGQRSFSYFISNSVTGTVWPVAMPKWDTQKSQNLIMISQP